MIGNHHSDAGGGRAKLADVARAAEALGTLAVARTMIVIAPFRRVVNQVAEVTRDGVAQRQTIDLVVQALDRAGRKAPFRTKCFERGLAAHWMLRRRGIATRLHYGIDHDEHDLVAHVWLSAGDEVIVGGQEMDRFAEVASWPPPPKSGLS